MLPSLKVLCFFTREWIYRSKHFSAVQKTFTVALLKEYCHEILKNILLKYQLIIFPWHLTCISSHVCSLALSSENAYKRTDSGYPTSTTWVWLFTVPCQQHITRTALFYCLFVSVLHIWLGFHVCLEMLTNLLRSFFVRTHNLSSYSFLCMWLFGSYPFRKQWLLKTRKISSQPKGWIAFCL